MGDRVNPVVNRGEVMQVTRLFQSVRQVIRLFQVGQPGLNNPNSPNYTLIRQEKH